MVMADRPEVQTAGIVESALTVAELVVRLSTTVATLPLHQPWSGPLSIVDNTVEESLREIVKALLTYSMNLPTPRLRSLEKVLDDLCRVVLAPIATRHGVTVGDDTLSGVPGVWVRPPGRPRATILSTCTAADTSRRPRGCTRSSQRSWRGSPAATCSSSTTGWHRSSPSPQGSTTRSRCSRGSSTKTARHDALPDEIPVLGYLGHRDPHDPRVSAVYADVEGFPPSFVARGTNEMFRDEIGCFVAKLRDTGIEVGSFLAPNMFHVYEILMPWAGVSRATLKRAADFLDRHLSDGCTDPPPAAGARWTIRFHFYNVF